MLPTAGTSCLKYSAQDCSAAMSSAPVRQSRGRGRGRGEHHTAAKVQKAVQVPDARLEVGVQLLPANVCIRGEKRLSVSASLPRRWHQGGNKTSGVREPPGDGGWGCLRLCRLRDGYVGSVGQHEVPSIRCRHTCRS